MYIATVLLAALVLMRPTLAGGQGATSTAEVGAISCRALEVHSDDGLKVTVVVFHQRDEGQRSQLTALLREHSGTMVEIQTADGKWRPARMVRLKACFGRGLLILPEPAPISERAEFILRVPQ